MNRKDYEKPTMQVVKLQHTGMLMTSGGTRQLENPDDYELEEDPFGFN